MASTAMSSDTDQPSATNAEAKVSADMDTTDNSTINSKERVDPELRPVLQRFPGVTFDSWLKTRTFSALMHIPGPTSTGVKSTRIKKGIGKLFYPVDKAGGPTHSLHGGRRNAAAVLWIHGGGRVMGSASGASESVTCSRIVQHLHVPVLSASYRLAPKHPFPAALDDLVAAYKWLVRRLTAEAKGKDDVRIAVVGESSGGGLGAELCQRLLDESQEDGASIPLPVAQLLMYPMLDDRTCVNIEKAQCPPHFVWSHKSNVYAWSSYLRPGNKPGDDNIPKYAAAARREDLSDLPPAWIVVGELDLFRDECREYAQRLERHGVETRHTEVKGGFHGFLSMGKKEEPVLKVWKDFEEFGRRHLHLFGDVEGSDEDV
mmetsp:Transcript_13001/g.28118  ORF Transcript_13001/g.28118 Transcript_13001/m.28118 type:complete len:374 (-) Transcript_13001:122-1243(-)|eukprot:CAMPEP_0178499230 /NCGR_PEP_ID=MMETSP0696-20121128/15711_1 /TAXON_ID=265572 /ORGANISM="Extubocellulus spinifer, Strain CCMP396" /LENGTH=373 /DNA_ID=CAMNT_0020127909 /DNA_START=137 /DNA_END=1258 /DNA_ORIENTATION=-